jgi:hypothetical protein
MYEREEVEKVLTGFAKQTEVLSLDKKSGKVTIDYNRIVDTILYNVNSEIDSGLFGDNPSDIADAISDSWIYEDITHFLEEIAFFFIVRRLYELRGSEDEADSSDR